jgi:hypothetical protein
MMTTDKTIAEALSEYEAEHAFARQITLPWEDRVAHMRDWQGGYRWFRSSNVVCLEKYRRLKASGQIGQ